MKSSRLLNKALAMLVLVFGATMAATAVSSAWRIDANLTEQFEARGRAIADSIAGSSTEVLLFRDVSTIQAMIDRYLEIQGASYIFVVDAHGEVISHTFDPDIPEEILSLKDSGSKSTRLIHTSARGDFMDISASILAGRVGYVHVGMDRGPIRAAIWLAIVKQLALVGLIFIASLLVAFFFVNKIVQPLNLLTQYANKLAAHDAAIDTKIDPGAEIVPITARTDEVGQLAQAFRHMVLELSGREEDLRQARDELELRVRERTAELAQTNDALRAENNERKRAEEMVTRQAQELTRSNSELEQFAYIASHDLQEPLRKVQSFGDLLVANSGESLGEEGRDFLKRMQNAAQRMQGLINDLLSYARVTSQAKPFVPVDLAGLVPEVVSDLETRVNSTGGRVNLGELPRVDGDPLQMRLLLQNLIGNALKFHRPNVPPVVDVQGRIVKNGNGTVLQHFPSGLLCEITVQDNGIGFEEKYLDRIFAPFQRLHGRGEYEGTGMGLAICRKIVERHGGTITARSTPGQGTTFIVALPLRQPKGEQRHA